MHRRLGVGRQIFRAHQSMPGELRDHTQHMDCPIQILVIIICVLRLEALDGEVNAETDGR